MPEFLVELYVPRDDSATVALANERACAAVDALRHEGAHIRYLHAIFVPENEMCFHVYDAASLDAVRGAVARAALPTARIKEVAGL
jgi:hypothetical protein